MILADVGLEVAQYGSGTGLPVIMLHEGLGSAAMWRGFPAKLAEASGRRVIVWSRRGYGASGSFDAPYDLDFMHREADAAEHLMRERGLERAHVYGHSDGASIALLLAARHPARVASLVLEAPHVFVEPICTEAIVALGKLAQDSDFITRLNKYHRNPAAVFRQWFAIWTDRRFPAWTIEAELSGMAVPTLLIQGEDDAFGTFDQLDRIAARLPQASQLRLSACGHSPHRDCEDAVLSAASAFLKDFVDG
jgi:pimeloyl-ACP methyl ester carboxylesterase